jgi:cytochrome o ubiquinol oxidase subunit 3
VHSEAIVLHEDPDHHAENDAIDVFGFWLYIMTDCILFGTLFATFLVLTYQGMPGIGLKKHIDLTGILIETFLLLASNFTFCLAMLSLYKDKVRHVQAWLIATFLLGGGFVVLEVREFIDLAHEGFRWDLNAQASAFFTLVGTHGFHVSCGLLWILVMALQLPFIKSSSTALRRMTYLGLFWNFLDIIWIFVFTVVYLMGAM